MPCERRCTEICRLIDGKANDTLSARNSSWLTKHPNGRDYTGPSLSLSGLRKTFGDVVAVDHLDLEVMRGECFGLLGPNGAGKTTTIEICEGLTPSDAGIVTLLGLSWKTAAKELRQRIGIQLQETQFPDKLTVEETLRLFRSFFKQGISEDEAIRIAQLEEKRSARVGGLSGGQKQRLAMACALVGDPELLFLDEPTTGLDPQARRHLWDLVDELKSAGRTIILTTHYMDEAERLCDRVAIMDHGRIIALGTPQQLIASTGGDHIVEFAVTNADATQGTDRSRGAQGNTRRGIAPRGCRSAPAIGQGSAHDCAAHLFDAHADGTSLERIPHPFRFARRRVRGTHREESAR